MAQYNGQEIDLGSSGDLAVHSTNLSKSYMVGVWVKPADTTGRWMPQYRAVYAGQDPKTAKRAIADLQSRGVRFTGHLLNDSQSIVGLPKELQ